MQAEFANPTSELSAEDELRIMELELSILKKRRELAQRAKEPSLKPVPEETPLKPVSSEWMAVQHGKVDKKPCDDDSVSVASTDINSLAADLESVTTLSECQQQPCAYYNCSGGKFYDLSGKEQTAKWAKRMRQRERDERSSATSSKA